MIRYNGDIGIFKNYFKTTFTVLKTLSSFKYTYMVKWWLEFSVLHHSKMKFEAHSATERGMAESSQHAHGRTNHLTTHSTHLIYG